MDIGRSRRVAASRTDRAKHAIEQAKRKREVGAVEEEAPIYDTLDDTAYAKLVAERRRGGAGTHVRFYSCGSIACIESGSAVPMSCIAA